MRRSKNLAVDNSALRCHVEAAEFGIDEGEHRWKEDVRSEDGLVDLVPEGVAVLALDAGVGDVEENEVREGVGEDGRPVSRNVDVAEDEVDEWRGKEDEARESVEEVRHRVEVAETLCR